ncbi:MAG: autotransporter domain-containing protein, partial [Rickettsiales bacterium]|nr:autotransporter domain-containing protein [Rickettsiales bacterium]
IYIGEYSSLNLEGISNFNKNTSAEAGGAIYSEGSSINKNNLFFFGSTAFEDNASTGYNNGGGAIFAKNSNVKFGQENENLAGKVIFRNNIITYGNGGAMCLDHSNFEFNVAETSFADNMAIYGGAVYSYESFGTFGGINGTTDSYSDKTLIFRRNLAFTSGGAIYINNFDEFLNLKFLGPTVFESNIANMEGGAIVADGYLVTDDKFECLVFDFSRMAIFRKNISDLGGAMYIRYNTNMNFNGGIRLWNNTVHLNDLSGVIHLDGHNTNTMVTINITQNDPQNYSIFKNPGSNGIYMERRATINFNIKDGDVYLFDSIRGEEPIIYEEGELVSKFNTINIYGNGWFNVREGGSIDIIDLNNSGKLSLTNPEATKLNLLNFTNSGTIRIGIFPKDNVCDKIAAKTIVINQGSILEIVAAKGTYGNGSSFDLLISEEAILRNENAEISLNPQQGLNVVGVLSDDGKIYRIFFTGENIIQSTHPSMEKLELEDDGDYIFGIRHLNSSYSFETIDGLDINQRNVARLLDSILNITDTNSETEKKIKDILNNEIIEKLDVEEQKIFLDQVSARFQADITDCTLLASDVRSSIYSKINGDGSVGIWVEPLYKNIKLAKMTGGSLYGTLAGVDYNFKNIPLGLYVNLNKYLLSGEYDSNRATIKTDGIGLYGGIILGNFDLKLILALHRNNYSITRSIEKLNRTAASESQGNTFDVNGEIGLKFKPLSLIAIRPFFGIQGTMVTRSAIVENNASEFNLEIESSKHLLAIGRFGLNFAIVGSKFEPFLNLEGKYVIRGGNSKLSANLAGYRKKSFENFGTEYKKLILGATVGFSYKLWKNLVISAVIDYQTNGVALEILTASAGLKLKF